MKKLNINKKAFTLTELIVVIAIIGILSVVLIPVLTGCIEDAKISNDTVLVSNINKVLKANEILDSRNNTAFDAINDAFDAGYGIQKLTPTTNGFYFMWDAEHDEFVLVNKSYGEIFPHDKGTRPRENLFALVGDHSEANKLSDEGFSIYLREEYDDPEELVIHAGLDVGEETNISSIRYENIDKAKAKDVIIRTNGGKLEINAPLDTVNHYGNSKNVNIIAVANNSYHENGEIDSKITLNEGHLVILKTAVVNTIVVNTTSQNKDNFSITIDEINQDKLPLIYAEDETVLGVLSDKVTAPEGVKNDIIKTNVYTKHVKTVAEFKEAINKNGEVILDDNLVVSETINHGSETETDHSVVLNLNGKSITVLDTFSGGRPIFNYGTMIICGDGKIDSSVAEEKGYGAVRNFGVLTIENGTFSGHPEGKGSAIDNYTYGSILTINGGSFIGGPVALYNRKGAVATVNGGKFEGYSCSKCTTKYGYTMQNDGSITVNNCEVIGVHGAFSVSSGDCTINGGSFKTVACSHIHLDENNKEVSTAFYALYVAGAKGSSFFTVNGGTFESITKVAVYIGNDNPNGDGGINEKAYMTIYGGKFISNSEYVIHIAEFTGNSFVYGGIFNKSKVRKGDVEYELGDVIFNGKKVVEENNYFVVK